MGEGLKHCPFCGSEAKILINHHGSQPIYSVCCKKVGCFMYYGAMIYTHEKAAISAWNQRVNE